jgi:hypothetical protein
MDILHEDLRTFIIISYWGLLTIRTVLNKISRENQNTNFMFKNFLYENHNLCEICEKCGRDRQATGDNKTLCSEDAIFLPNK